jgi:hypothetical protein
MTYAKLAKKAMMALQLRATVKIHLSNVRDEAVGEEAE